uniref:Uncharacterized protein n=1 Tax=Sphingobacterium sp. (strain 21) TaxID=743722 RepID=F4C5Z3_SPHS2
MQKRSGDFFVLIVYSISLYHQHKPSVRGMNKKVDINK